MLLTRPLLRSIRAFKHTRAPRYLSNQMDHQNQNYESAVRRLFSLQSNAAAIEKWRNERTSNLGASLRPEILSYLRRLKVDLGVLSPGTVHIAGTKGKGSTCAMVESIIRHHGYSTGLFTSPHLVNVRERIRVNGEPISEEVFTKYFWLCYNTIWETKCDDEPWEPSFFKFLTVMAIKLFHDLKIDCTVLEVGIGGRSDSTNVFDTLVCCGISTLDYDHMNVLGDTLGQIAWEKSGIMKKSVPCVTVAQVQEGHDVVISEAKRIEAPLFVATPWSEYVKELPAKSVLGLDGAFQETNASLAAAVAHVWLQNKKKEAFCEPELLKQHDVPPAFPVFELTPEFAAGLKNCKWAGRAQTIQGFRDLKNINFYLDGAHTPASIHSCFQWYTATQPPNPDTINVLVFNCKSQKDGRLLLKIVSEYTSKYPFHQILFTGPIVKGSINCAELLTPPDTKEQESLRQIYLSQRPESELNTLTTAYSTVDESFDHLYSFAKDQQKTVSVFVTGSLYLVGGYLEYLQFKP